jgi:hypothetical protein
MTAHGGTNPNASCSRLVSRMVISSALAPARLTWISQTRTYQGGEPGRHLHFSGTQDLVCW